MKRKFYNVILEPHTEFNPSDRTVMVVGEWSKVRVHSVDFKEEGDKIIQTPISYYQYTLVLGKSICHSEDTFDYDTGFKLAVRRINEGGIGTITTNSYSMLTPDACEAIILNKAKYIATHIDKFITPKGKNNS